MGVLGDVLCREVAVGSPKCLLCTAVGLPGTFVLSYKSQHSQNATSVRGRDSAQTVISAVGMKTCAGKGHRPMEEPRQGLGGGSLLGSLFFPFF